MKPRHRVFKETDIIKWSEDKVEVTDTPVINLELREISSQTSKTTS